MCDRGVCLRTRLSRGLSSSVHACMHDCTQRAHARVRTLYRIARGSSSALQSRSSELQSEICFDMRALGRVEFDLFAAH